MGCRPFPCPGSCPGPCPIAVPLLPLLPAPSSLSSLSSYLLPHHLLPPRLPPPTHTIPIYHPLHSSSPPLLPPPPLMPLPTPYHDPTPLPPPPLFPLHFHLQVRMYKHSRCVVGNTSLLPLQFCFQAILQTGKFHFLIFSSWVRIVMSKVGTVSLLRFRHFNVFNLSSRPCLIGVGYF